MADVAVRAAGSYFEVEVSGVPARRTAAMYLEVEVSGTPARRAAAMYLEVEVQYVAPVGGGASRSFAMIAG